MKRLLTIFTLSFYFASIAHAEITIDVGPMDTDFKETRKVITLKGKIDPSLKIVAAHIHYSQQGIKLSCGDFDTIFESDNPGRHDKEFSDSKNVSVSVDENGEYEVKAYLKKVGGRCKTYAQSLDLHFAPVSTGRFYFSVELNRDRDVMPTDKALACTYSSESATCNFPTLFNIDQAVNAVLGTKATEAQVDFLVSP